MRTVHLFIPPKVEAACGNPEPGLGRYVNALAWLAGLAGARDGESVCGPCMGAVGEALATGRIVPLGGGR